MQLEQEDFSELGSCSPPSMMDMDLSCQYHAPLCDYMIAEEIYEMSPDESDRQIIDMVIRQAHTEPAPHSYNQTYTVEVKREKGTISAR
jgi:hypothetical protein